MLYNRFHLTGLSCEDSFEQLLVQVRLGGEIFHHGKELLDLFWIPRAIVVLVSTFTVASALINRQICPLLPHQSCLVWC